MKSTERDEDSFEGLEFSSSPVEISDAQTQPEFISPNSFVFSLTSSPFDDLENFFSSSDEIETIKR